MKFRAQSDGGRRLLVLAAVFSLAINVATRYCFIAGADAHVIKKVMAHSPSGQRQRLLSDGLHWVAPAASSQLLEPRPAVPVAVPSVRAVTDRYSEDCLYNRPPPAC